MSCFCAFLFPVVNQTDLEFFPAVSHLLDLLSSSKPGVPWVHMECLRNLFTLKEISKLLARMQRWSRHFI